MTADMHYVERATPSDCFAIERLDRLVWENTGQHQLLHDSEATWRVWIENALVYTVSKDQGIIGVVLAFPTVSKRFCLHKLFVHTDYRGKSFGSRLLHAVLHETDKLKASTFANLFEKDAELIHLFRKHGYFVNSERSSANRMTNTLRMIRSPASKPFYSINNYLSSLYSR